jgi:hypothetical protein
MDERRIRNIVGNLMIGSHAQPTGEEKTIMGALAREAIRLSVEGHKEYASRLKGVTITRTIADTFSQSVDPTYLDMGETQAVIGMGSAFDETPANAASLLLDSLEPRYTTELYVDEAGLTPHAGMLLEDAPEAAHNIYASEAIQRLATCIAPVGKGEGEAVNIKLRRQNGKTLEESVPYGEIKTMRILNGETCKIEATAGKGLNLGRGKTKHIETTVTGGLFGVLIDARGRPLRIPEKKDTIRKWGEALTQEAGD